MRKQWTTALRSRLEDTGGPYGLLDAQALTEAVELFACTTSAREIVESCHLVGLLHWHRGLAFGDERAVPEARTASALLVLVQLMGAELPLPDQLPPAAPLAPRPDDEGTWEVLLQTMALRIENGADPHAVRLAVHAARNAVADGSRDPGRLVGRLRVLGLACQRLFEETGDLAALEEAVAAARRAVEHAPATSPERMKSLHNLAAALRTSFERTGELHLLQEAVDAGREVVRSPPEANTKRYVSLDGLADSLRLLYEHTGESALLDEALRTSAAALAAVPDRDEAPAALLVNSAILLRSRFERAGDPAVLNEAIVMSRRAVSAAPRGTPTWRTCLYNLGGALDEYSRHTGDLSALDEAGEVVRAVVRETPVDHPDAPLYRSNLVGQLHERFRRTGDVDALDEAIGLGTEAVEAAPKDHPNRWMYLANLAVSLKAKAEHSEDPDMLQRAIAIERQVAAPTLGAGHKQATAVSNLGNSLRLYHQLTRDESALREAISVGRDAMTATADDHPFRSRCEFNLAASLSTYGLAVGDEGMVEEAIGLLQAAASRSSAPTSVRVSAAREWGELAVLLEQPELAARGFALGVGLLPRLAARGLVRADATRWMTEYSRLASDAAACALTTGRPEEAVELLEVGRGVLLGQALESRTDLTELRERDSELADRFAYLCTRLDGETFADRAAGPAFAPSAGAEAAEGEHDPDRRRTMAQELEALLARVRTLSGLERFLLPPQAAQLTAEAHSGPVVVVNVSRYRCDALILTTDGVRVCELPEARYEDLHDLLGGMHELIGRINTSATSRRAGEHAMAHDILPWLWDKVAEPVLERLGFTDPVAELDPQRMWWVPCGPLALLPLHAAGHHLETREGEPGRTVMDRVVSSYTPTVRALAHARARRIRPEPAGAAHPPRILAVAMPHTPGASNLPGARQEYDHLTDVFPTMSGLIAGEATREAVLSGLTTHPWVHFACHAGADPTDPSRSHLLVHDHVAHPLSVLEISRLRLETSEFAYLSACSTAVTKRDLADESIHVASSFQLAGFPYVIGTLWEVNDTIAAEIAKRIYARLESHDFDAAHTAACVHRATRLTRRRFPNFPTLWSAHIHMGA
ncbi:CHAT domain-containing protein [Embleya sp. NPDC008237]|uniref:CHAT domain-containing protein n=1 Tax=Embleya sp. NPDC008237 TaxID=3363978 RepID=UPI0036EFF283